MEENENDKTDDRVRVVCTPKLIDFISNEKSQNKFKLPEAEWKQLEDCVERNTCTADDLRIVSRLLARHQNSVLTLRKLLKGTSGVKFPQVKRKPNPELQKRRQYLLAKQQQREYARMCKDVAGDIIQGKDLHRNKIRDRDSARQMSHGVSMILMVGATFTAGRYMASKLGYDNTIALISGLALGIIMLFVEMVLFIIRATREERFEAKRSAFLDNQRNLSGIPPRGST